MQTSGALQAAEPIIRLSDLHFAYGDRVILDRVSLDFRRGGMVGLIGPNGAGKTTLLRLLMGMAQPAGGAITVGGRSLTSYSRREIARLVTLVPQDTQIEYPFVVEDLVLMGRHPHLGRFQPPSEHDIALVRQAMRQTGIDAFAERTIGTLSGGERQRVLVARAIAQETPIVLLDEVTANLDVCHQLEILELAHAMAAQGRLVIATIHDLAMASRFFDRLLLLSEGRIQADATPAQVLNAANLGEHFYIAAVVEPSSHLRRGLSITALRPLL